MFLRSMLSKGQLHEKTSFWYFLKTCFQRDNCTKSSTRMTSLVAPQCRFLVLENFSCFFIFIFIFFGNLWYRKENGLHVKPSHSKGGLAVFKIRQNKRLQIVGHLKLRLHYCSFECQILRVSRDGWDLRIFKVLARDRPTLCFSHENLVFNGRRRRIKMSCNCSTKFLISGAFKGNGGLVVGWLLAVEAYVPFLVTNIFCPSMSMQFRLACCSGSLCTFSCHYVPFLVACIFALPCICNPFWFSSHPESLGRGGRLF